MDHKIYLIKLDVEEYHRLEFSISSQDFIRERVQTTNIKQSKKKNKSKRRWKN